MARVSGLTSGISGERSESAAWCARHGRGTGGGSPLGALTEGTQHRRGRGVVQREEKASDGSLRWNPAPSVKRSVCEAYGPWVS